MNNIPDSIVIELMRELIRLKEENKLLRKLLRKGKNGQERIRETISKAHN